MKLYLKVNQFILFVLLITSVMQVSAQETSELHEIKERDYAPYPQPDSGYVTDIAEILSDAEEERIEKWLWQVESKSGIEIIVLTLGSIKDYPGTNNRSIETFATALFNTYGIGNMPENNGILLLVAKTDRKARIELGKYYAHSRDRDAQKIMNDIIVSEFKKGDYVAGITNGTEAIILEFANMKVGFPWHVLWVVVGAIVSLIIGLSLIKNGRKGWGYVFIGFAIVLFLLAIYLVVQIFKHMPSDDSGSWSSGGMGGFGGGSSGGGGATGGW